MASASSPDGPSWRGSSPSFTAPPAVPSEPAWRAAGPAAAYASRWWKLGLVGLALTSCLVAVSYAALWLKPPDAVRVMALEAGYDTNLTVPPNATGIAAGRDLLHFVNSSGTSRGRLKASEPVTFKRGGTLLPELDTLKERTLILHIAAHGGRDPEGAFLFPDDTTPNPAHRVRMKAILERLAKLPAATHKLLILDATQVPHFADVGVLHNDFADALEQLDAEIAAVPNLVVLTSAGTDQRSWVCPEWGRTTFAHYLQEGIEGLADADRNQRLTAWELFEHLRPRVHDWARDNRGALQTPVILPKVEGESRARAITLASVSKAEAKPVVAPTPFEPPAELQQLWSEYQSLWSARPSPIEYAPHIWRQYETWVLRYESLLLNGTPEAAAIPFAKAADARRRMEALRKLPVSPQNLTLPFSLGGLRRPGDLPPSIVDGIARLATTPDADRGPLWAILRTSIPDIEPEALRILWCEGLVTWVATDPATRLSLTPSLVALVTEGLSIRPSEIHLLEMFAKHAPHFTTKEELGPLIHRLLEARVRSERLASGRDNKGQSSLYAAIQTHEELTHGDVRRRRAEDLTFSTSLEDWRGAHSEYSFANPSYMGVAEQEDTITSHVQLWHRTAAILPEMSRANWAGFHELTRNVIAARSTASSVPNGFDSELNRIASEYQAATERVLASRPEFDSKSETRSELVSWWSKSDPLLNTPARSPVTSEQRVKLLLEMRRVSRQLLVASAAQLKSLPEVSLEATRASAFQSARKLGSFQLDRLGRAAMPKRFDALAQDLDSFALQVDARQALTDIGAELGEALTTLPSMNDLALADRRVRLMPAAATVALGAGPTDALRRKLTSQVLLAQAERTYVDHWYGGAKPYYRVAVEALLNDARAILGRKLDANVEAMWARRLEKESPFPLAPALAQKLWLTDEPNLQVTYPLRRASDDPAGPGFAVFWQEPPFGKAIGPISREVRETGLPLSAAPAVPVTATLSPPAGAKPKTPTTIVGNGGLQAFFRGRFADADTRVTYSPVPDRASVVVPPPTGATLAVRADPALQAKFGTATGSVAIVLDASGSMRPPKDAPPGNNGRYPIAIDTLEKLLRGLPAGTTVSVWSFGSRTPNVTSADETIQQHLPPTVWTRDNSAVIDSLLSTVRGLEPWEESSVMRALLRARQGLVAGPGPFKAVVLVTDAVDNRFAEDRTFNPRKETIKDALKTRLADSGLRVGVVAIPVEDKSESTAQEQFKTVESLSPAGKFVPPAQVQSLLAWLRSGLNPRIRFTVSPESAGGLAFDLAAGDDAADSWYAGRVPPGTYAMKLLADREYRFPLQFQRGDRLLLRLVEDVGNLRAERIWYAAEAPAIARAKSAGDASAISILLEQAQDQTLKMLATLEDRPARLALSLAAEHLGETWFELTPTTPNADPFALRFTGNAEHPAPTWNLDANGWPSLPGSKTPAAAVVEAWWSPRVAATASLRWEVPPGIDPLAIPSTRLAVSDNVVSLDSIRVEEHEVPITTEQSAKKPCLVVRFTHAPGKPVWARLLGVAPAGSEVRIYRSANKVTCLFWGDAVDATNLKGLEIVSLAEFQKDATAAGRHLKVAK